MQFVKWDAVQDIRENKPEPGHAIETGSLLSGDLLDMCGCGYPLKSCLWVRLELVYVCAGLLCGTAVQDCGTGLRYRTAVGIYVYYISFFSCSRAWQSCISLYSLGGSYEIHQVTLPGYETLRFQLTEPVKKHI